MPAVIIFGGDECKLYLYAQNININKTVRRLFRCSFSTGYICFSFSFFLFFSSLCVCYPDLRHPIYVTHLLINYINHIGTICSAPNVLSFFCSLSALLQCFFFNSHILNRIFVSPFGMYHFRTWLCASKRGCTPPTTTMTMLMLMMMFSVLIW